MPRHGVLLQRRPVECSYAHATYARYAFICILRQHANCHVVLPSTILLHAPSPKASLEMARVPAYSKFVLGRIARKFACDALVSSEALSSPPVPAGRRRAVLRRHRQKKTRSGRSSSENSLNSAILKKTTLCALFSLESSSEPSSNSCEPSLMTVVSRCPRHTRADVRTQVHIFTSRSRVQFPWVQFPRTFGSSSLPRRARSSSWLGIQQIARQPHR